MRNALNGGGIYAGSFAKIHLIRSNISHSNATAGGGVYVDKSATGIFDSIDIHSNFAQFGAGAAFILGVNANIVSQASTPIELSMMEARVHRRLDCYLDL